jgi:hypothetical protein
MSWRMARSLDTLLAELNEAAPKRSKVSDGGIGDAAHASRDSDHNPWVTRDGVGIVRARDFTHDPAGGLDCGRLATTLAVMLGRPGERPAHPALGDGAYVIFRRRIISRARIGEGWRPYTGSNPHDKHLHLSVALANTGYDSTRAWDVTPSRTPNITAALAADNQGELVDALKLVERDGSKAAQAIASKALQAIRDRAKANHALADHLRALKAHERN